LNMAPEAHGAQVLPGANVIKHFLSVNYGFS
jgi:hypothetical protein